MIVNMLYNLSHICFSYHIIIKCVDFETIYYVINLYFASSFIFFREFDSVFILNILLI